MKLSSDKIDEILDSASNYIYDDLWSEFDSCWVEDYLSSDYPDLEYDIDDIDTILVGLKNSQKESQYVELNEERQSLKTDLYDFLDSYNTHLEVEDIGKILVNLANDYLNE